MFIEPAVRDQVATWHHDHRRHLALGVWTEKKDDFGEDDAPLVLHNWKTHRGLLGVFDGAGGAGAASVGRTNADRERSNAWVASRAARGLVHEWFYDTCRRSSNCDAEELRELLATGLAQLHVPGRRKVYGTMRRYLPTTVAAIEYVVEDGRLEFQALWAGDSRAFLLDPVHGLQQLSRDDTSSSDALELLVDDPPMTNMAHVGEFVINAARGGVEHPCVLLCATDGFYGYVETPAQFEDVLLRTLEAARDLGHWAELLADEVRSYTGDDASLSLVSVGYEFTRLQDVFARRTVEVRAEFVEPVLAVVEDRAALVAARQESWDRYRVGYEGRMPGVRGEET